MINAIIATGIIFIMLVLSEFLWRKAHIRGEFARKFIHIIAGTFIAFLPFWVSYGWVALLAMGFILANLLNRYTPLFHAIHAITRRSWGDLLFGVGILITALLRPNKWLFAGAILQVALADGLAAIIGSHYGKHKYKLFDHSKSPIGTLAFYITSFLVLVFITKVGGVTAGDGMLPLFLVVPATMTVLENVSGYGTDNVMLPLGFLVLVHVMNIT